MTYMNPFRTQKLTWYYRVKETTVNVVSYLLALSFVCALIAAVGAVFLFLSWNYGLIAVGALPRSISFLQAYALSGGLVGILVTYKLAIARIPVP